VGNRGAAALNKPLESETSQPGFVLTHTFPRTYRFPLWVLLFGPLIGIALVASAIWLIWLTAGDDWKPTDLALMVPVFILWISLGLWLVVSALRTKVVLYAEAIEVQGVASLRRLDRQAISHRRTIEKGYGQTQLRLHLHAQSERPLKLPQGLQVDAAFNSWMASIPDKDVEELQASTAALLADPALGINPTERSERLERARKVANAFHWVTTGMLVWVIAYPRPYDLAVISLALMPWVAVAMVLSSSGFYRLDGLRNEANPQLGTAFVLPPLGLLVRSLEFDVLDFQRAISTAAIVTVVLLVVIFTLVQELRGRWHSRLLVAGFFALYAWDVVIIGNARMDQGAAELFEVEIVDKHASTGRNSTYELTLEPWGRRTETNTVTISRNLYYALEVGEKACIGVWPGALQIKWFTVFDCDEDLPE